MTSAHINPGIDADQVAALLGEVKNLPAVDAHAEFDDYGIDSLDLLRLADLLEARAGVRCGVDDLVAARSAAQLAALLNATAAGHPGAGAGAAAAGATSDAAGATD